MNKAMAAAAALLALLFASVACAAENTTLDSAVRKGSPLTANVDFQVDVHKISSSISQAVKHARDRAAFVKNARNTAYYSGALQRYNVMVFNLGVSHTTRLYGVKYYNSFNYNGVTYGVWVFTSGEFHNRGDGGYINWAYQGCVTQRVGGRVLFRAFSGPGRC